MDLIQRLDIKRRIPIDFDRHWLRPSISNLGKLEVIIINAYKSSENFRNFNPLKSFFWRKGKKESEAEKLLRLA